MLASGVLIQGAVFEVGKTVVGGDPVEMVDRKFRLPSEHEHDQPVNLKLLTAIISPEIHSEVSAIYGCWRDNTLGQPLLATSHSAEPNHAFKPFYTAKVRHFIQTLIPGNRLPSLIHGALGVSN